jgi:hypothetical protein
MTSWSSGGKAYLVPRQRMHERIGVDIWGFDECTYQDQNAIMKPNHEKKKTRPWMLITLNRGTERALWLIGLSSGAFQSNAGLKPTIFIGRYLVRWVDGFLNNEDEMPWSRRTKSY